MDTALRFSSNGQAPRKEASKARTGRKADVGRKVGRLARRVAVAVGSVGVGVLALSVHHCTEAISTTAQLSSWTTFTGGIRVV